MQIYSNLNTPNLYIFEFGSILDIGETPPIFSKASSSSDHISHVEYMEMRMGEMFISLKVRLNRNLIFFLL